MLFIAISCLIVGSALGIQNLGAQVKYFVICTKNSIQFRATKIFKTKVA